MLPSANPPSVSGAGVAAAREISTDLKLSTITSSVLKVMLACAAVLDIPMLVPLVNLVGYTVLTVSVLGFALSVVIPARSCSLNSVPE